MADERARIGIVVALREERVAVEDAVRALDESARARTLVVQGGLGGAMAAGAAGKLLGGAPQMQLLVSCGFSGGLVDSLAVGDVFLASAVTARPSLAKAAQKEETLTCSAPVRERTAAALTKAGRPFHEGSLITLAQPVLQAEEKRSLGDVSGAQAVDMEAAAVARVAREHDVEFLALRTISDAVDDALPPEVSAFLDEQGRLRAGKVLRFAVRGPGNVKELWRLKSRSDRAAAALGEAIRIALPVWVAAKSP